MGDGGWGDGVMGEWGLETILFFQKLKAKS
jgi:hypothetical protein